MFKTAATLGKIREMILALSCGCLLVGYCHAADLTKIDRTIAKEPTYRSKPRYCLLAFGPKAQTHVWLVLDGRTLYVDRNGNGDLTESGEALEPSNDSERLYKYKPTKLLNDASYELTVLYYKSPIGKGAPDEPRIRITDETKRVYAAWGDETGPVHFASRAQDASIIHYGGPLQMGFEVQRPLVKKSDGVYELMVGVGTKGLGKGSFAHLKYWNNAIPKDARPTAVLEFPNKRRGGPPIKVKTILAHRC